MQWDAIGVQWDGMGGEPALRRRRPGAEACHQAIDNH